MGRSGAEARGDAGLQDSGGDGGSTGVGIARARKGEDSRAVLFQIESSGDGSAHGEGGAVGSAADDVPPLIRPEGHGDTDRDDPRI